MLIQKGIDLFDPLEVRALSILKINMQLLEQVFRISMLSNEFKDLIEQFLLMQIEKFEGHKHLVIDGMLVHKLRELLDNFSDQSTIIVHSRVDIATGNDFFLSVHALVYLDIKPMVLDVVDCLISILATNIKMKIGRVNMLSELLILVDLRDHRLNIFSSVNIPDDLINIVGFNSGGLNMLPCRLVIIAV